MHFIKILILALVTSLLTACNSDIDITPHIKDVTAEGATYTIFFATIDGQDYSVDAGFFECIDGFIYEIEVPGTPISGSDGVDDTCNDAEYIRISLSEQSSPAPLYDVRTVQ